MLQKHNRMFCLSILIEPYIHPVGQGFIFVTQQNGTEIYEVN